MLKTSVIHPQILDALGRSGHFAQVVIADGNFPLGAMQGPHATTVYLNFRPGLLDALQVLEGIERDGGHPERYGHATTGGSAPGIHQSYRELLGPEVEWEAMALGLLRENPLAPDEAAHRYRGTAPVCESDPHRGRGQAGGGEWFLAGRPGRVGLGGLTGRVVEKKP